MSRTGAINATYMWQHGKELEPKSCLPEDPLAKVFDRITAEKLNGPKTNRKKSRKGGRRTPVVLRGTGLPDPLADFQLPTEIEFDLHQIESLLAIAAANEWATAVKFAKLNI